MRYQSTPEKEFDGDIIITDPCYIIRNENEITENATITLTVSLGLRHKTAMSCAPCSKMESLKSSSRWMRFVRIFTGERSDAGTNY